MNALRVIEHADADSAAAAVATALALAIRTGVARHGSAWLALAGGSTPFPAYRRLAAMPLPWADVHLLASDERWVPADHGKRNEAALRAAFAAAHGVQWHPLVPESPAGPADAATAREALAALGSRAFDAVLLGMGTDAHIASLFPHVTPCVGLDADSDTVAVAVTPDPLPSEAPYARVSLGVSRLIDARTLLLMLAGAAKREVLETARTRPPAEAPVNALLVAAPNLAIHWSP